MLAEERWFIPTNPVCENFIYPSMYNAAHALRGCIAAGKFGLEMLARAALGSTVTIRPGWLQFSWETDRTPQDFSKH